MNVKTSISHISVSGVLSLLLFAGTTQWLFVIDQPLAASIVFLTVLIVVTKCPPLTGFHSGSATTGLSKWIPVSLYILTICLRTINISKIHSLQDLSARFTLVALEITRGNFIFPCVPRYEFDEVLVSWLFAPFIYLFGHSWITIKLVSIVLSSLLVPIVYVFIRKYVNANAAFLASGLIIVSSYFQYCDPLIDMTRFTLITIICLLIPIQLEKTLNPLKNPSWIFISSLTLTTAVYLHSLGRMVVIAAFVCATFILIEDKPRHQSRSLVRLSLAGLIFVCLVTPFLLFVISNPEYLAFKKKQLFGYHELYPLSWKAFGQSALSILRSFHYRARTHILFPDNVSLLHPVTGAGSIGGLWLLSSLWRRRGFFCLIIMMTATTVPLLFVTPGRWRGLYYTPAIAFLTISAGLYYSWCIGSFVKTINPHNPQKLTRICSVILLSGIALIQIPTFFEGPFAPNQIDLTTNLYTDMSNSTDIPHYFSASIPETKPGYAIFDLLGSAWLSEYSVIKLEPLSILDKSGKWSNISPEYFESNKVRLVLSPEDAQNHARLYERFDCLCYSYLPESGLIAVDARKK